MTSSSPDVHLVRGAGWGDVPQQASTTSRTSAEVNARPVTVGFRCARSF